MQRQVRTNNTIRLFTYEDAIELYKHNKAEKRKTFLSTAIYYLTDRIIIQKIIGILLFLIIILLSLIVGDVTAIIFILPICLGLVLSNKVFI